MKTLLSSAAIAAVLVCGCGGATKMRPTADQLLVQADATIEMVENVAIAGSRAAWDKALKDCAGPSHMEETICIDRAITPWFVLMESIVSAQEALLFAYKVRRDGGDALNAMACSREALTVVVRRLKDLKTNPPTEFASFVVSVIKTANGAQCVQNSN